METNDDPNLGRLLDILGRLEPEPDPPHIAHLRAGLKRWRAILSWHQSARYDSHMGIRLTPREHATMRARFAIAQGVTTDADAAMRKAEATPDGPPTVTPYDPAAHSRAERCVRWLEYFEDRARWVHAGRRHEEPRPPFWPAADGEPLDAPEAVAEIVAESARLRQKPGV